MGTSLSTVNVPNWQTACASKFNCISDGLVNILGEPIFPTCSANGSLPADVWGISTRACQQSCGSGALTQVAKSVDFTSSAITMTTWLLPWLALIAQLPFEANGSMNLLSACLSIGSPALAAYSIALTAFNRRYISIAFRQIKEIAQNNARCRYMVERVDAAAFILQESQQCPMRANQKAGELASLIILDEDNCQQKFWLTAEKDLRNTRRGFTQSFLAQGSPDVGLQFASSTVWSWMFPVVFGYVRVGSQCKVGTIKKALTDHKFVPERGIDGEVEYVAQTALCPNADLPNIEMRRQTRLLNISRETVPLLPVHRHYAPTSQLQVRPSLNTSHTGGVGSDLQSDDVSAQQGTLASEPNLASSSNLNDLMNDLNSSLSPLTWWGFDVRGDERREGPIFNYARIFTWFTFVGHVRRGPRAQSFHAVIQALSSSRMIHHMLLAACVALFLQWGTTGAAIFIAYRTPAIGLGCRSGSYLIYGVAATLSWLILVFSNIVSHEIMQRLEAQDKRSTRSLSGLAVITRLTGKSIAVANAAWLIASSVMEDIGTFQTCWCQTDAFQFHENGWTPVFKDASDLRNAAGGIWIGGFIWSIGVCIAVSAVFAYQVNGERDSSD
ncbi:hypothetical protein BDP27DRAFT_1427702 [Rhodocollybia butyracea]|uniref:Uncharacterized protein n=1 Tax=Rhodocollybia butyracea TaxID=206335 RepID=A0A9P5U1Q5_9AGAR|nr:hypothetical protein BDP27DRAFT_1427702 [Rhodocollybia butyracea]